MRLLPKTLILLAVAGIFSLSACVQNANPAPAESNKPIGMANPASKYCVSQGGGRLRKRKIKHAKPVAAVAMA